MKFINLNKNKNTYLNNDSESLRKEVATYREKGISQEYHTHKHLHLHKHKNNNITNKNIYNVTINKNKYKQVLINTNVNPDDPWYVRAFKGLFMLIQLVFMLVVEVIRFVAIIISFFVKSMIVLVKDYLEKKEKGRYMEDKE